MIKFYCFETLVIKQNGSILGWTRNKQEEGIKKLTARKEKTATRGDALVLFNKVLRT
jgi:hypothetical protein